MKIKKVIIPIAGFGTRLLPVTKSLPKAMLPIVDKPVIHYLVEEAVASGIEEIIIIAGHDKKKIEDYFNRSKELEEHLLRTGKYELLEMIRKISELSNIQCISQEKPIGLGHAIYCARDLIDKDETFAVILGDDIVYSQKNPCLGQLIDINKKYQANILGVQNIPREFVSYYGIIKGKELTENLFIVEDLVEKPDVKNAPSSMAILGRYLLHRDIFRILEDTKPGVGGEIQLTDALKTLSKTQQIYAYVFEGIRYDVGDKLGYLKATTEFALRQESIGKDFKEYLIDILSKD